MKNKKKGFTLVELIVVLAILAILAAMLVPALTGYIDKANEKKITSTTRQVVTAAQTVVSDAYAKNSNFAESHLIALVPSSGEVNMSGTNADGISIKEICELGEIVKGDLLYDSSTDSYYGKLKNNITRVEINYNSQGKITQVILTQDGVTCTYLASDSSYVITK